MQGAECGSVLQHETPAAIGAIDPAFAVQVKVNERVTERAAAAVAGNRGLLDLNRLRRFHRRRPLCLAGGAGMIAKPFRQTSSIGRLRPFPGGGVAAAGPLAGVPARGV